MHIYFDLIEVYLQFKYVFVLSIQIFNFKRKLCLRVLLKEVILEERQAGVLGLA
jgi:hypothetical protein